MTNGADIATTTSWTVPQAVAACLAAEGVRQVFGLMGAGTIALTHHLETEHRVRYCAVRHESAAVGAADGYARATGKVGVGFVTWGPGLTNTLTSLITAQRGASPVVLVAGDASTGSPDMFPFAVDVQGLNQGALLGGLGVEVFRISPDNIAPQVQAAFRTARDTARPVAILLPIEHLLTEIPRTAVTTPVKDTVPTSPPVDPDQVRAAMALVDGCSAAVVLAGRGVALADAGAELIAFADRIGAVIVTTLRGLGIGDRHPAYLGIAGGFSPPDVAEVLQGADVLLAFGAGLNRFTTRVGTLFPNAAVVQCDVSPQALERQPVADCTVLGDARSVLSGLLVEADSDRPGGGYRVRAEALTRRAGVDRPVVPRHSFVDMSDDDGMDPRSVYARIGQLLPRPRTFVLDVAAVSEFAVEFLDVRDPQELICMFDYGAVGSGLGAGIGAALGRPDRLTALIVGDGGLMMTLGELDTAVRARVPLLIVCMNNRAYGSERYHMKDWGIPENAAFFDTPDLAEVARSVGCDARTFRTLEDLATLPDLVRRLDGPLFIDCLLTNELLPAPMRTHT